MVAIKAGKLSYRDVWPDAVWTDHDWLRKRDDFLAECKAEGYEFPELHFEVSRRLSAYQRRTVPTFRERQEIWKRIYPMVRPQGWLSDEEMEYLIDLLSGVNHPTGQDILLKLKEKTNDKETA